MLKLSSIQMDTSVTPSKWYAVPDGGKALRRCEKLAGATGHTVEQLVSRGWAEEAAKNLRPEFRGGRVRL